MMKTVAPFVIVLVVLFGLSACTSQNTIFIASQKSSIPQSPQFNPDDYQSITITVNDKTLAVRAFNNISYLANSKRSEYQVMNVYVPESYFVGGVINGYTADTAPIFFPIHTTGDTPTKPLTTDIKTKQNVINEALMRGYVVVSAGTNGQMMDKSFAMMDLKSAIGYLKANDDRMVGRADRIVVSGTSTNGTMSVLLGINGDIGFDDGVFAVSTHRPMMDLKSANTAYEWQFYGVHHDKHKSINATFTNE